MNAHKFVEQYGLEKAKEVVSKIPLCGHKFIISQNGEIVYLQVVEDKLYWYNQPRKQYDLYGLVSKSSNYCLSELKQAIADFELVEKVGGLEVAKKQVKQAHEQGYLTISVWMKIKKENKEYEGFGCLYIDKLEAAITRIEEGIRDE